MTPRDGHRPVRRWRAGATLPALVATTAVAAVIATPPGVLIATAAGMAVHLVAELRTAVASAATEAVPGEESLIGGRRVRTPPWGVVVATIAIVALVTTWRAATEHAALGRVDVGLYRGWVTPLGSPVRSFGGIRQIMSVEGRRFETWTSNDPSGGVVGAAGEKPADEPADEPADDPRPPVSASRLFILGETRLIEGEPGRRRQMEHIVGRLVIHRVMVTAEGSPLDRWRARVRAAISRGADHIGADDRSLFLGLIIGDRDQPDRRVTERFRDSGLAHLSVASGHDVALVLVLVAPLSTRLRPLARWIVTVLVVGAFADLIGSEPSITRASVMAIISASAFVGGLRWRALDVVMLATVSLVLIDPFLVHLPAFWMSIGATAGVVALGPSIARRLARHPDRPGHLVSALSVTLGAQAGVALPIVLTFGSVPLVSLPANLAAVPLGSAIKVYGLPAAIVSGAFPVLGPVVMAPVGPMVRALDRIAAIAADLEPEPHWSAIGWVVVVVGLAFGRRSWSARST